MTFKKITHSLLLLLTLVPCAYAQGTNQQSSYQFTQAFSDCVKSYRQENYDNETAGSAMSGLMNGGNLARKGPMDSRYWQYMNCLDRSVSGTRQQSLPVAKTCAPNGRLPAGVEGKRFSFNGATWICSNGSWSGGDAAPPLNNGGQDSACVSKTVTHSACSATLPNMPSGKSEVLSVTQWANNGFYKFNVTASCSNGTVTVHKQECVPQSCDSGERLKWFSTSLGSTSQCEGEVDSSGIATHSAPSLFFRTLLEARRMSNAKIGNAEFICEDGAWRLKTGSCRSKNTNELICTERLGVNGALEFSCN